MSTFVVCARLPNVPVAELKWKYISSRSTSNVTSVSMIFCKCTRLLYVCENWKYRIFLPLSILLVYNTLCVYLSAYILIFILLYFFVSKHSIKILVSQSHKHIWYVLSDAPHTYAACLMLLLLNGCAKARFLVLLRVSLATLKWIVLNLGIYGDVCASNAISGCISKPTYFIHIYIYINAVMMMMMTHISMVLGRQTTMAKSGFSFVCGRMACLDGW